MSARLPDTDRGVYDAFRARFGDLVAFPPYEAPGSGASVPGDPAFQEADLEARQTQREAQRRAAGGA